MEDSLLTHKEYCEFLKRQSLNDRKDVSRSARHQLNGARLKASGLKGKQTHQRRRLKKNKWGDFIHPAVRKILTYILSLGIIATGVAVGGMITLYSTVSYEDIPPYKTDKVSQTRAITRFVIQDAPVAVVDAKIPTSKSITKDKNSTNPITDNPITDNLVADYVYQTSRASQQAPSLVFNPSGQQESQQVAWHNLPSRPLQLRTLANNFIPHNSLASEETPHWLKQAAFVSAKIMQSNRPKLAIVMDDLGIKKKLTQEIIDLDLPITAAFLPYAEDAVRLANLAKKKGHEIVLHIPLEPIDPKVDPGPNALLYGMGKDEIQAIIRQNISRIKGISGVNNHMGSLFTTWGEGLNTLMEEIKTADLYFLDSMTHPRSKAYKIAHLKNVPATKRDIFLDHVIEEKAIERQMKNAIALAEKNGTAIVIGHPHKETIQFLRSWANSPDRDKVDLVFVSTILRKNYGFIENEPKDNQWVLAQR